MLAIILQITIQKLLKTMFKKINEENLAIWPVRMGNVWQINSLNAIEIENLVIE